jgi:hypothetical protein
MNRWNELLNPSSESFDDSALINMVDLEQRKYEIDSTGLVKKIKSRYDSHYVKDGKFKVINNCNNVLKTFLYLKYKDHLHPFAHFVTVFYI